MRAGRSKISTVANRPSHTVDSIVSAVVGVSSGTRKLSTWLVRRLIGEVPLLAMATVDTSPYNHQPGVADPSRDLGSVGRRPLSETASPEPRPPPASHQPPSLQYLTPPPPQNHPSPKTPFTRFGNFPNHPQPPPNKPLPFAPPNRHTFSARPPC